MLKFITEFGPLVAFFIGYKTGGILDATLYMLVASAIGLIVTYIKEQKINMVNLISSGLLLVSASLTLFSGNSIFIKMKPTVLYCVFACVFLVTNFKCKPAIQYVLGAAIKFKEDKNWYSLNLRFMWFFILMAFANEFVWRNFSEDLWVSFKVFGAMPITIIFILLQMPFIMKNKLPDDPAI
jgi:intracellular septation protein